MAGPVTADPLVGRGAVVTGGGRGIGAAIARALSAAGAGVVAAARTSREIEDVASALRARGAKAWAIACDVTVEGSVIDLGRESRRVLGTVDILVNNAGASASAPLRKITLEDWERMLRVNATGTFLCTREFAPEMAGRGWGRIVNVASLAGLEGAKYVAHYSAAKHAVLGFTRSVALEFAGTGVMVNAVCPGYVDTPMTDVSIVRARVRGPDPARERRGGGRRGARPVRRRERAERPVDRPQGRGHRAVKFEIINPESLGAPKGWNNGLLAPKDGRLLFIAGQAGWEEGSAGSPPAFADQFARALDKVLTIVRAAGGEAGDLARVTIYVTDLAAYRKSMKALGEGWRARMGRHYPAVALVEVTGLVDRGALVEIEATAVIAGAP